MQTTVLITWSKCETKPRAEMLKEGYLEESQLYEQGCRLWIFPEWKDKV